MATSYKKITIIVEDDEHITTTVIPIAHSVEFDITYDDTTAPDILTATKFTKPAIDEVSMRFRPLEDASGALLKVFQEDK